MKDTVFNLRPGDEARAMQGHNFDGSPMATAHTPTSIECAGGLYTTANDMARWMNWHLDRAATADRDLRLLDHAAYLYRDGLTSVAGLDDAGPMDAMGLGWVINMPNGNRPLILQKTGGLQGSFAYLAIAPTRGVAAFFVMNAFNVGGFQRRGGGDEFTCRPACAALRKSEMQSDANAKVSRARAPLPAGYRQGIISAITVIIGFSLLFLRYWTFEAEGDWTIGAISATGLLALAVALELYALWRSLQPEDDDEPVYRVTLRWFLAAIVLLLVSVLLAALTASHVIKL